jgi:DNA-binding response OmpR family regulator
MSSDDKSLQIHPEVSIPLASSVGRARVRVLVVDDDPSVRGVVRAGLEPIEVLGAGDGRTGLAMIRDTAVDVVLLDVRMPDVDGFEILREVRRDPATKDLPVLMLSGRTGELEHLAAFRLGADGYLTKPFDPEELETAVLTVASRTPAERLAVRADELARAELLQRLDRGLTT